MNTTAGLHGHSPLAELLADMSLAGLTTWPGNIIFAAVLFASGFVASALGLLAYVLYADRETRPVLVLARTGIIVFTLGFAASILSLALLLYIWIEGIILMFV